MIGVVCPEGQRNFVAEFFEFFKTPWEFYRPERSYDVLLATDVPPQGIEVKLLVVYSSAGNEKRPISNSRQSQDTYVEYEDTIFPVYGRIALIDPQGPVLLRLRGSSGAVAVDESSHPRRVIHVGYDLFEEVRFLLESGQPKPNARIPTLEIHISMLRNWIVDSGIPLVEIPPTPSGHDFIVCLTHDVDFIRIRDHKFDHTMWGFLRRASVDSLLKAAQGRLSLKKCFRNLKAALSLPAVYFGICKDFWLEDFQKFVELERNFKSTFFFIPYKSVPGEGVNRPHSERRAAAYDVSDEQPLLRHLMLTGHEVGLHGIDAWHSVEKGVAEFNQIEEATGKPPIGVRMHWLCFDETSPQKLEEAGFQYDSTVGYNDAVGYRAGTSQVICQVIFSQVIFSPRFPNQRGRCVDPCCRLRVMPRKRTAAALWRGQPGSQYRDRQPRSAQSRQYRAVRRPVCRRRTQPDHARICRQHERCAGFGLVELSARAVQQPTAMVWR